MSKTKDTIEELRAKLFERKKEEIVEVADETILSKLDNSTYDVVQDPSTNSRSFLMIKIKYDLENRKAEIEDIIKFNDKTAAFGMIMDKENRKYLYEKNKGNKK